MTREQIDRVLAMLRSGTEDGAPRIEPARLIASLAEVVANQEARLRALEPCPGLPYCGPHYFVEGWEACVPVCKGCQIEAPAKHRWNKSGVCRNEYCSARKAGS